MQTETIDLGGAVWIWPQETATPNSYADFYIPFVAAQPRATLFLCADTNYYAMLNGKEVPSAQYPYWPQHRAVQTVSLLTVVGKNELKIRVFYAGQSCSTYKKGVAGLCFSVHDAQGVLCCSGPDTACRINPDYSPDAERVSWQLGFSFCYTAPKQDFFDERFPIDVLHSAVVCAPEADFFARPIAELKVDAPAPAHLRSQGVFYFAQQPSGAGEGMQHAFLGYRAPETLGVAPDPCTLPCVAPLRLHTSEAHGVYVLLDLEKEHAGHFLLDFAVKQACTVYIGYGEHLTDLRVRTRIGARNFAAVYHAKAGRQTFYHPFLRMGCRYLMLLVEARECSLYYAGLRGVQYPVVQAAVALPRDALAKRIVQISSDTLRLCMHEHYEDCPWREQAYYAMDSRIQMLCGYQLFQGDTFARACLALAAGGVCSDGLLEMCAPASTSVNIPAFTLIWPVQLWEYVQHSGDHDFAREMLPVLEGILAMFAARTVCGVQPNFTQPQHWNFYEWRQGLDGGVIERTDMLAPSLDAPLTGFYTLAQQAACRLYRALGMPQAAQTAQVRAQQSVVALHTVFFCEQTGLFADYVKNEKKTGYSALTQSLAVLSGAVSGAQKKALLAKLALNEAMTPTTLSSSIYRYEALLTDLPVYGAFVVRDIEAIWGKMLFEGATSFWETQEGEADFENAGSLCHAWSAVPVYLYYAYDLGVVQREPLSPKEKKQSERET